MRPIFVCAALFAVSATAVPRHAAIRNVDLQGCKPLIMVYSRGTWEPGEPPSQVAAPLIKALETQYPGKLEFRNAKYDGGASGYLGGGAKEGIDKMTEVITRAAASCPNSGLLIIGYSQGAQVTHKTVDKLPSTIKSHIRAIVVFGDPFKGRVFSGVSPEIVHTECFPNDMVCNGLPLPVGAHNEYDKQIPTVTDWIVKTLGPL